MTIDLTVYNMFRLHHQSSGIIKVQLRNIQLSIAQFFMKVLVGLLSSMFLQCTLYHIFQISSHHLQLLNAVFELYPTFVQAKSDTG